MIIHNISFLVFCLAIAHVKTDVLDYFYDYDDFDYSDYEGFTSAPTVAPELSQAELKKCDPKCIFKASPITSKNIASFPKCATVCAQLLIDKTSGLSMSQLTTAFKNMKFLTGGIRIHDTNFTNLNFLAGLQKLESENSGIEIMGNMKMTELGLKNLTTVIGTYLNVYDNEKLLKLNLPKWKTLKCPEKSGFLSVSIDNFWKDNFCLTSSEVQTLMTVGKDGDVHVSGIVCAPAKTDKKKCTKPTVGCEELVGDLEIGSKFDTKTVKSLKILYGSLIVKKSNFMDFNFLGNLTQIVQIDEFKSAIDVQNNKNLKSVTMPKLKRIWSTSLETILIDKNSEALFQDFKSCYAMRAALLPPSSGDEPSFSDKSCEQMENEAKKGTTKKATTKKASG